MSDPTVPMQKGLVGHLKAHPAVAALVGDRVYDNPPAGAERPYVQVGNPQVLPDKSTCVRGTELSWPVHGWTRGPSTQENKRLGAALVEALDEDEDGNPPPVTVLGFRLVLMEVSDVRYLADPDPLTQHAVVTFRALLEPT